MSKREHLSEAIERFISYVDETIEEVYRNDFYAEFDTVRYALGEVSDWLKNKLKLKAVILYGYKSEAVDTFWLGDQTYNELIEFIYNSQIRLDSLEEVLKRLEKLKKVAEKSEKHFKGQETIDKQSFTYKGFKVEALNLSKETASAMLQAIDCLEEIFKKRGVEALVHEAIEKVYLQHNPSEDMGKGWGISQAYYQDRKVYLFDTILDLDDEMPEIKSICYGFIHEIGHWVHLDYIPREAKALWDSGWDGIMEGRADLDSEESQNHPLLNKLEVPTTYARKNPKEDFAETFARFMIDPNSISEIAKERLKATLSLSAGFGRKFMRLGSRIERLMYRVAKLEQEEKCSKAEDYFFDNPLAKSVREFAESEALSNDPETAKKSIENSDNPDRSLTKAKKESILAPPPPAEIKEKPGGKEFSTLNQLVIDTEEKVKGVPKGFEEAPKVDPDEIKKESEKTLKEKKKEVVRKVMRRKGYDSFNA
jgi:hypothetical protein